MTASKQSQDETNLFCYKTLCVSDIFFAHHQEFSTVRSALVSFMQVLMTASKQSQDETNLFCYKAESGWNPDSALKRSSKPA